MIRFHYALSGGPILNLFEKISSSESCSTSCTSVERKCECDCGDERLIIANIVPSQTSVSIKLESACGKVKIVGKTVDTKMIVFTLNLKVKPNSKHTFVYSSDGTSSTPKLIVYKDCYPEEAKQGTALVRTIVSNTTSNMNTDFTPVQSGTESFTMNGMTTTTSLVSGGVYTIFFDAPSTTNVVLYNKPRLYEQHPLCFERYIGLWYVIASLGIPLTTTSYVFSEDSAGRFMTPKNNTSTNTTNTTNTMMSMMGMDTTETITTTENVTIPFKWIVHSTDYDYFSLNGTSTREQLVILCRCKKMDQCTYKKLLKEASRLGYKTNQLNKINQ